MKYLSALIVIVIVLAMLTPRLAAAAQLTEQSAPQQHAPAAAPAAPGAAASSNSNQTGADSGIAQPPPEIVHHGEAAMPAGRLFSKLKSQFAGGWLGPYKVVRSNPRTRTLVVRRDQIDPDTWSKWAYCKVGPEDLLDNLKDGAVTMTIKLHPVKQQTFTAVSADFLGTYGLVSSIKNVQCVSRGVLEDQVLKDIAGEGQQPRRVAGR